MRALRERYLAASSSRAEQVVDVVRGREAVRQRFNQLQRGARREVLEFVKGDVVAVSVDENVEEEQAISRGVVYRFLLERQTLERPGLMAALSETIQAGVELRVTRELPIRLIVVDREIAMIPLAGATDDQSGGALLLRAGGLLDLAVSLFEVKWRDATRLDAVVDGAVEGSELSARERQILLMLNAGLTDRTVATRLGLSARTVQRYVADMMEVKYGIPWIKVNFIGAESTAKSLRKIAKYFGDPELTERVEAVIAEEMPEVEKHRAEARSRCEGKTVMLFVGGSRAHHYQDLFSELGMKTVAAGYEFAHRDDYEGRRVLPKIKIDADSRNIEELTVEPDPERYRFRKTEAEVAELKAQGFEFSDYEGMMAQMAKGTLVIDDISHYEMEKLIAYHKPDIFCAGIKEKYVIQKMGVPCKQLHSYDYSGPYAGFRGAVNFYHDIDRLVNSKIWNYIQAPWQKSPELIATYVK